VLYDTIVEVEGTTSRMDIRFRNKLAPSVTDRPGDNERFEKQQCEAFKIKVRFHLASYQPSDKRTSCPQK
jgi:hypothetical protein